MERQELELIASYTVYDEKGNLYAIDEYLFNGELITERTLLKGTVRFD